MSRSRSDGGRTAALRLTTAGITGGPVLRSDRETMCVLLDPRTHHLHCRKHWRYAEALHAQKLLRSLYVEFFLKATRPTADLEAESSSGSSDDDELFFATIPSAVLEASRQKMTMEEWEQVQTPILERQFKAEFKA